MGRRDLLEIVCSGRQLPLSVDVTSMKLFTHATNAIVALVFPTKNVCKTFSYYTSCDVKQLDTRKSSVSFLVTDLSPGKKRQLGCNISVVDHVGDVQVYYYSIYVESQSKAT